MATLPSCTTKLCTRLPSWTTRSTTKLCTRLPSCTTKLCTRLLYRQYSRNYSNCSIKQVLEDETRDPEICVKGWIKSIQQHKGVTFVHINDGSGSKSLQIVIPPSQAQTTQLTFGTCVEVQGTLTKSPAKGQQVELISSSVNILGPCNPNEFPIQQRTKHSPQYLRDFLHLRPKTNSFGALLRIRNIASMAVHSFFQKNNYLFIHTPVLTSSDCEGACEVFKVEPLNNNLLSSDCDDDDISHETKNCATVNQVTTEDIVKSNNFFTQQSFLTVSGQLHLEVMTGAFTKVYNFGPVFRADKSKGRFHLSEFYMVEAEVAFVDKLKYLTTVMEQLVKFVCEAVVNECHDDVANFSKYYTSSKPTSSAKSLIESTYERLSYTDAIKILQNSKESFHTKVFWGCDLKKEHEMYLTKAVGNIPVFVTDYPSNIKPFYARRNDDGLTVAASDLLLPGIGELCGSSLREERANVLAEVMTTKGLMDQLQWYLELRKFGSCSHGGFGLGFERLLMALLGANSLKDVTPFPRWPRHCQT